MKAEGKKRLLTAFLIRMGNVPFAVQAEWSGEPPMPEPWALGDHDLRHAVVCFCFSLLLGVS